MANDDIDRQEVDRLVRVLNAPPPPVMPTPVVQAPASQAAAEPAAAPGPERQVRRVSRWTNARLLMPAVSAPAPRWAFASGITLPQLPTFTFPAISLPTSSVFVVRAWVTLGVLLSISMAYWPYPKTYLVGLLLYLFAVALVVVAGIWSAKLTWDVRLGGAHTISLGVVLWAIVLVAEETLPALTGL